MPDPKALVSQDQRLIELGEFFVLHDGTEGPFIVDLEPLPRNESTLGLP